MKDITIGQLSLVVDNIYKRRGYELLQGDSEDLRKYLAQYIGSDITYSQSFKTKLLPKPRKGLFLAGNTGVGKTTYFKVMSDKVGVNIVSSLDIASDFMLMTDIEFHQSYFGAWSMKQDLIMDDLGSEDNKNKFGNANAIHEFLYKRYEAFMNYGSLTHFSTNISSKDDLINRYGSRVYSRLKEMCFFTVMNGNDRRCEKK